MFAVPQKGQDGDRYQGAGAAARRPSGGVVRLSRLSENRSQKVLHPPCPSFPTHFESKGDAPRGLLGAVVRTHTPSSFTLRMLSYAQGRLGLWFSWLLSRTLLASCASPVQSPSQKTARSATCDARSGQNVVVNWSRGFAATFTLGEVRDGRKAASFPRVLLRIRMIPQIHGSNYQRLQSLQTLLENS